MKRTFAAIVAAAALGLAGPAMAGGEHQHREGQEAEPIRPAPAPMAKEQQDVQKHMALVDLYLASAKTNAKALQQLSQLELERGDRQLVQEAQRNLDQNLERALTHVGHVKKMHQRQIQAQERQRAEAPAEGMPGEEQPGEEIQPVAGEDMTAQIDELEQTLRQARTSARQLRQVQPAQIGERLPETTQHLQRADEIFGQLARQAQYTRLDQIELERVPVRGVEEPAMPEEERPAEEPTEEPAHPHGY
jgi:hypothetical protein